ncbi:hypothetical protein GIB67_004762 [Kingdonia uniflora]|uniref:Ribosomal protein L33 n=1 Tax=Kingdonia uniflora TaxID=39325 RepID=A0A7J7NQK8_9MAGN|nr:hypothetical protein GIB67_004762 [Kingdonia uniflora]
MSRGKGTRIRVALECNSCIRNDINKESPGISRYITQKKANASRKPTTAEASPS